MSKLPNENKHAKELTCLRHLFHIIIYIRNFNIKILQDPFVEGKQIMHNFFINIILKFCDIMFSL